MTYVEQALRVRAAEDRHTRSPAMALTDNVSVIAAVVAAMTATGAPHPPRRPHAAEHDVEVVTGGANTETDSDDAV
jgi:hypothetical protein